MTNENTETLDTAERNAKNLERIAEATEAIAYFLNALLAGEAESQDGPLPKNTIMTQNGPVELR